MTRLRRLLLPAAAFALVAAVHYVWRGTHPVCGPGEECCDEACAPQTTWLAGYFDGGWYWLGFSYAGSAAFAVVVIRRALERRAAATTAGAARGIALSAFLPFVGCWLAGCCGSPMLAVYLNLLGAAFLPFAKPLVAGLTAVMLTLSWLWMRRRERAGVSGAPCAPGSRCDCS